MAVPFNRYRAIRVVNKIDHMAKGIPDEVFESLQEGELADLLLESVTLEDIENTLCFGMATTQDIMLEAISAKKARLLGTMQAFTRALNTSLAGTNITADKDIEISKPRKSGTVAVITAKINLSDGQSISVVFHAPDNDPMVIKDQDTLIAFRFLLNARDVTHSVAPSGGNEVSLKQVTTALSNLAERNSAKFVAKQAENTGLKQEIDQAAQLSEQLEEELRSTSDTIEQVKADTEDLNSKIQSLQSRIDRENALQEKLRSQLDGMKVAQTKGTTDTGDFMNHVSGMDILKVEALQAIGYTFSYDDEKGYSITTPDGKTTVNRMYADFIAQVDYLDDKRLAAATTAQSAQSGHPANQMDLRNYNPPAKPTNGNSFSKMKASDIAKGPYTIKWGNTDTAVVTLLDDGRYQLDLSIDNGLQTDTAYFDNFRQLKNTASKKYDELYDDHMSNLNANRYTEDELNRAANAGGSDTNGHSLSPEQRKAALEKIWKKTPKDYKSGRGDKRTIMVNGSIVGAGAGTTIVPLNSLSDDEIAKLLNTTVGELSGAVAGVQIDPSIPKGNSVATAMAAVEAEGKRQSFDNVMKHIPDSPAKAAIKEAVSDATPKYGFYPSMTSGFDEALQILLDNNVTDHDTLMASMYDFHKFGYLPADSRSARANRELAIEKQKELSDTMRIAAHRKTDEAVSAAMKMAIAELPKFHAKAGSNLLSLVNEANAAMAGSKTAAVEFLEGYNRVLGSMEMIGYGDSAPAKAVPAQATAPAPTPAPTPAPAKEPEKTIIPVGGSFEFGGGTFRYVGMVGNDHIKVYDEDDREEHVIGRNQPMSNQLVFAGFNDGVKEKEAEDNANAVISGLDLSAFIEMLRGKPYMSFDGQDAIYDALREAGYNTTDAMTIAKKARTDFNMGKETAIQYTTPEEPKLYWYGMRTRPFGIASQPDGHAAYKDQEEAAKMFPDAPEQAIRFGIVGYPSPLSERDISHYSLTDMQAKPVTGDEDYANAALEDAIAAYMKAAGIRQMNPSFAQQIIDSYKLGAGSNRTHLQSSLLGKYLKEDFFYQNRKTNPDDYEIWRESLDLISEKKLTDYLDSITVRQTTASGMDKSMAREVTGELNKIASETGWLITMKEAKARIQKILDTHDIIAKDMLKRALATRRKSEFKELVDKAAGIMRVSLGNDDYFVPTAPNPFNELTPEQKQIINQAIRLGAAITVTREHDGSAVINADIEGEKSKVYLSDDLDVENFFSKLEDWIEDDEGREKRTRIRELSAFVKGARMPKGWNLNKSDLENGDSYAAVYIETPFYAVTEDESAYFRIGYVNGDFELQYNEASKISSIKSVSEAVKILTEQMIDGSLDTISDYIDSNMRDDDKLSPAGHDLLNQYQEQHGITEQPEGDPALDNAIQTIKELIDSEGMASVDYLPKLEEAFAAIERADKVDEYEPLMNEAADKLNDILDMEAQAEA